MHKNYVYLFVGLMDKIPTFVGNLFAGKDHVNNNTLSISFTLFVCFSSMWDNKGLQKIYAYILWISNLLLRLNLH